MVKVDNIEVRRFLEEAFRTGWRVEEHTESGHIKITRPLTKPMIIPSTPSDSNSLLNCKSQMRNLENISGFSWCAIHDKMFSTIEKQCFVCKQIKEKNKRESDIIASHTGARMHRKPFLPYQKFQELLNLAIYEKKCKNPYDLLLKVGIEGKQASEWCKKGEFAKYYYDMIEDWLFNNVRYRRISKGKYEPITSQNYKEKTNTDYTKTQAYRFSSVNPVLSPTSTRSFTDKQHALLISIIGQAIARTNDVGKVKDLNDLLSAVLREK